MTLKITEMRRFVLGEGNFVQTLVGRITLLVLFATVFGFAFTLLFLVNQSIPPVLLKFTLIAALGAMTGLMARRLLWQRHGLIRFFGALFGIFIAFGVMNLVTRGFIGLDLLRIYPVVTRLDAPLQLLVAALAVWIVQKAWTGTAHEIIVEPRSQEELMPVTVHPPERGSRRGATRGRTRVRTGRAKRLVSSSLNSWWSRSRKQLSTAAQAPSRTAKGKRTKIGKSRARRGWLRRPEVHLGADVEHRCPYCLEQVRPRDPRGIKICKVCKTWHHADCWAVTGVCQVPHEYVS
ncbi:MAG: hypothetical protein ACRDFQ_02710 [Anaerolineales bacterium]